MKRPRAVMVLLLCMLCLPMGARAMEAPYYTMTQTYDGRFVYSQDGYLPDMTLTRLDGKNLKRPADVFIDSQDRIYISDEGNKRVLQCDADGVLIRAFMDGFKSPGGLYVRNGRLYVTDVKLEAVRVFDTETGEEVFRLTHPGTALYGVKSDFKPLKVAVDEAGGMYVISKGNTNGIAQFSADGTFLGYFGANETNLSLGEKLKRLLYTEDQLAKLKRNVPATPTSLAMDARGLVYTVTTGIGAPKRLNMAGANILTTIDAGFANPTDVAVGAQETIFVVNEKGYILEYARDGRILFYFGGEDTDRTRTGLFVAAVAIDLDSQGRLYVLDRDKALLQRFQITEYAALVHEALGMYQEGLYAQSREPWEKVIRLSSMFDYAQMGLGRSYYKLERYGEALRAFRLGGDKAGYSDAYWEVRNVWLQENILYLIGGAAALALLAKLWRFLRKKNRLAMRISEGAGRIGNCKLLRELRFMTYFLRNPADAYYGVKHEGKVSVLSSSILYALTFLIYMVNRYACGFLFKTIEDGRYQVPTDIALVLGGIALFLVSCNLICSVREGEGTFKQLYCGTAYALTPYILMKPLTIALSYLLTYNEAFLITLLDIAAIAGCLVLLVMMVKTLQNYSFRETIGNLLLTIFTMLMIVIALLIAAALVAQLWEFITAVWKEASFYRES